MYLILFKPKLSTVGQFLDSLSVCIRKMAPLIHPLPGMTSTVSGVSENRNRVNIQDQILFQLQQQIATTAKPQVSKTIYLKHLSLNAI